MKPIIFLCSAMLILSAGCKSSKPAAQAPEKEISGQVLTETKPAQALPSAIVYKTTRDFSDHVPVTLDARHEHIVAYPSPSDLYYQDRLAKPVALTDGYWLDNRGINEHVAFLDYTYEEYRALEQTPTVQQLETRILERYPLTEFYVCGKRGSYTDEVAELNDLIKDGFPGCRKVEVPRDMNRVPAPKL